MNDLMSMYPTDNPTLTPCSYVTVQAVNPLPTGGCWDEEAVGDYAFPEWLNAEQLENTALKEDNSESDHRDDRTVHTLDDDDASTNSELTSRSLFVMRRRHSSSDELSVSSSPDLARNGGRRLTPAVAAEFLRDRVHTFANNMEVLATINTTTAVGAPVPPIDEEEEFTNSDDDSSVEQRANPVARFIVARVNTFSHNVEMMSTVLAEQAEAYFAAAQDDPDDFYIYEEEGDYEEDEW